MATYTYRQFRKALRAAGFDLTRRGKHETWEKVLEDGTILQVRISHQGNRDIPSGTFHEMLRQAGMDEETFRALLVR